MKQHKIPGMVYLPLLVFLSISLYQTAIGFTDLVGEVFSWGFSIGITMIMFFLTHTIGNRRINHQGISGLVIFFTICSLFSYSGNFNAIYTQYQTEQLYRDEITLHKQQLEDLMASSTKALNNFSPENSRKALKVEQLTNQLVRQITDDARPGLGERAKAIISEIEDVLGQNLTEFAGTPEQLAQKYQENIKDIANKKFTAGDLGRVDKIKEQNRVMANGLYELATNSLSSSQYIRDIGYDVTLKMVDGINKIGVRTQEFINDSQKFSFEKVKFENQEVGKIAFSFKSGFTKHPFISLLLSIMCLFLDWAVVLYLVIRYGKDNVEPYQPKYQSADL